MICTIKTVQANAETTVKAVSKVDIHKYSGKWYEIARLPMYFQRKCQSNVTAQYSLNPDNTLNVINSCKNKEGQIDHANGIAFIQNRNNSQLKVSFLPHGLRWIPFTRGDYWILRLDPEYKVALVGGPSKRYLWILSRSPTLDSKTYQSYLETAKQQGFDISKLIVTPQNMQ
ncbi:MAG: lipocalin family protein [Acinetobacter sp.]